MTEQAEPSLGSYLFHMRRSFKASYKAPAEERDIAGTPDILRLFDNSVWGISLEGVANIVTRTEDALTDQFFTNQYFHHIQTTYLYLYILVLHQKYALLHLANLAAQLPHELQRHRVDPETRRGLLNGMKDLIVRFMLRSSYVQVSRSTHHAALYEWMRARLKVDSLFRELHEAMDSLASLTETAELERRQKEDELKRETSERFNKKITGISAVFLPLSVITGLYGMDSPWLAPLKEDWWLFAAFTACAYAFTYVLFKYWFNKT